MTGDPSTLAPLRVVAQPRSFRWLDTTWYVVSSDVWTDRVIVHLAEPDAPFPEHTKLPRSLDGDMFGWTLTYDGTTLEKAHGVGGWRNEILFVDLQFRTSDPPAEGTTAVLEAVSPSGGNDGITLTVQL